MSRPGKIKGNLVARSQRGRIILAIQCKLYTSLGRIAEAAAQV
jgi:hypothetical protein